MVLIEVRQPIVHVHFALPTTRHVISYIVEQFWFKRKTITLLFYQTFAICYMLRRPIITATVDQLSKSSNRLLQRLMPAALSDCQKEDNFLKCL